MQDIPRGHPDCLAGKTIVVTGVLDTLYRSEVEDLIKRHSGRITGSISGRTSFLLVGQQCGNSKTRQVPAQACMQVNLSARCGSSAPYPRSSHTYLNHEMARKAAAAA